VAAVAELDTGTGAVVTTEGCASGDGDDEAGTDGDDEGVGEDSEITGEADCAATT